MDTDTRSVYQGHGVSNYIPQYSAGCNYLPIPNKLKRKCHWPKCPSLAAQKDVNITTFRAANDEDFIKMMTFPFQCKAMPASGIEVSKHGLQYSDSTDDAVGIVCSGFYYGLAHKLKAHCQSARDALSFTVLLQLIFLPCGSKFVAM